MATHRIHAVEITEDEEGESLACVQALCGIHLISSFSALFVAANVDKPEGLTMDTYLAWRRKTRIYPQGERPYVTVQEFCEGEDGCDAIDCVRCRCVMDDAISRYWRKT